MFGTRFRTHGSMGTHAHAPDSHTGGGASMLEIETSAHSAVEA
jgi:hypothetical protein